MKEPLTLEKALELNVQRYAEKPASERERIRAWIKEAAYGHPDKATRDFNTTLYGLVLQVESSIAQAQRPPLPTPAETNAFLLWAGGLLAKIGGGLAVIGGGLYLVGVFIVGTGNAFMAGALANSEAIFYGVCGLVGLVVAVAAYRNWPKNEETTGGEAPVKIQNIVNNIYISQSQEGDIVVNSEKNG